MDRIPFVKITNRLIAVLYIAGGLVVAFRAFAGQTAIIGSVVVIAVFLAQAVGHAMLKRWALKISAAVVAFGNLLAIPYLFANFEAGLLPPLWQRVLTLLLLTAATVLMVLNYRAYTSAARREVV